MGTGSLSGGVPSREGIRYDKRPRKEGYITGKPAGYPWVFPATSYATYGAGPEIYLPTTGNLLSAAAALANK
jgi:hypothetical protein